MKWGIDIPDQLRTTLELLITSQSEKEIASTLDVSVHVVHSRVKQIYRCLGVSSRAELMARVIADLQSQTAPTPVAASAEAGTVSVDPTFDVMGDRNELWQQARAAREDAARLAAASRSIKAAVLAARTAFAA